MQARATSRAQQILSGPDHIDRASGPSASDGGAEVGGVATYALKRLLISEAISGVLLIVICRKALNMIM